MKALMSTRVGPPETLELIDVADPVAGEGEVVIAVKCAGVNFPDVLIIEDKYQFKPQRPFAPGGELAGVVESVGAGVAHLTVGQRVLASTGWGALAEKVKIAATRVQPIPDAMPFDEASAFMLTYGTSYYALKNRGHLQPGETMLVTGAAGGVGVAAIELGKAMGARVIAAVSSAAKAAFASAAGADGTVIYPAGALGKEQRKALAEEFKRVCDGGADVVYDAVGGDYCEPALRAMNWNGRYLVVGFAAGPIPSFPLNLPLLKGASIVGVFWGDFARREPEANQAMMTELAAWYQSGAIKPVIDRTMPMSDLKAAYAHMGSRSVKGKLVMVN